MILEREREREAPLRLFVLDPSLLLLDGGFKENRSKKKETLREKETLERRRPRSEKL